MVKKKATRKKRGPGRPRLELDVEQVRALAQIQCTYKEIAAVMRCSIDVIQNHYTDVIAEGREEGKSSLRRAQFKKALEGNSSMLIWLGKHYLDQHDEIKLSSTQEPEVRKLMNKIESLGSTGMLRDVGKKHTEEKEAA
jgi:hypothetical protein